MTNTNTNANGSFNFLSKEAAIALLLDARKGQAALNEELAQHEAYMSDLCQAMLNTFGSEDAETGKKSLQLDLGDGSARGHIVVQRGDLYFVRERNSGRPVGSKNRKAATSTDSTPAVEAKPEVVVEEPSVVTEVAETASEAPKNETVAEVMASLDGGEPEVISTGDTVVDAILATQQATLAAIREHARSTAPGASSAAE